MPCVSRIARRPRNSWPDGWPEFNAVGQVFDDFSEVTDDIVVTALSRSARAA